jgi:sulfur transfer protein SufE
MRALEAAVERLAGKLHVTVDPRDNWGRILIKLDDPIKKLPNQTPQQQRKKDQWSECHAALWHVKNAWRDPSMHPRRNYDEKEASQILAATKAFFEHLATL